MALVQGVTNVAGGFRDVRDLSNLAVVDNANQIIDGFHADIENVGHQVAFNDTIHTLTNTGVQAGPGEIGERDNVITNVADVVYETTTGGDPVREIGQIVEDVGQIAGWADGFPEAIVSDTGQLLDDVGNVGEDLDFVGDTVTGIVDDATRGRTPLDLGNIGDAVDLPNLGNGLGDGLLGGGTPLVALDLAGDGQPNPDDQVGVEAGPRGDDGQALVDAGVLDGNPLIDLDLATDGARLDNLGNLDGVGDLGDLGNLGEGGLGDVVGGLTGAGDGGRPLVDLEVAGDERANPGEFIGADVGPRDENGDALADAGILDGNPLIDANLLTELPGGMGEAVRGIGNNGGLGDGLVDTLGNTLGNLGGGAAGGLLDTVGNTLDNTLGNVGGNGLLNTVTDTADGLLDNVGNLGNLGDVGGNGLLNTVTEKADGLLGNAGNVGNVGGVVDGVLNGAGGGLLDNVAGENGPLNGLLGGNEPLIDLDAASDGRENDGDLIGADAGPRDGSGEALGNVGIGDGNPLIDANVGTQLNDLGEAIGVDTAPVENLLGTATDGGNGLLGGVTGGPEALIDLDAISDGGANPGDLIGADAGPRGNDGDAAVDAGIGQGAPLIDVNAITDNVADGGLLNGIGGIGNGGQALTDVVNTGFPDALDIDPGNVIDAADAGNLLGAHADPLAPGGDGFVFDTLDGAGADALAGAAADDQGLLGVVVDQDPVIGTQDAAIALDLNPALGVLDGATQPLDGIA